MCEALLPQQGVGAEARLAQMHEVVQAVQGVHRQKTVDQVTAAQHRFRARQFARRVQPEQRCAALLQRPDRALGVLRRVGVVAIAENIHQVARAETAAEARLEFNRVAAVEGLTGVKGDDLAIDGPVSGTLRVSFSYRREVPLFGPASLAFRLTGVAP